MHPPGSLPCKVVGHILKSCDKLLWPVPTINLKLCNMVCESHFTQNLEQFCSINRYCLLQIISGALNKAQSLYKTPQYNVHWIKHSHVEAYKFFTMEFYKGFIGK